MNTITLRGVRTHNLKNIDLELPRDKLIVITGLSGSGKSSLAFDTLYAEGQRRYVESLSAYARQFLSMMEKPDVEHIEGLSPAISIEQKSTSHNPRSTVGTVTEIYDYLRLLFARVGTPRCPTHDIELNAQTVSQMVDEVLELEPESAWMILAPVITNRKGEHVQLLESLRAQGFIRARINGEVILLDDPPKLALRKKHTIEVVVDRFKIRKDIKQRLAESFETALRLGEGLALVVAMDKRKDVARPDPDSHAAHGNQKEMLFSANFSCPQCGYALSELEPRLFSFNSPIGACPDCDGLGNKQFFDEKKVVTNPAASLADGAVRSWDKKNQWYFQLLESLAAHYQFDLFDTPFENLPDNVRQAVLYGSGKEKIEFVYYNERGGSYTQHKPFEGVVPNLARRYRETDSDSVREDLSKYLSHHPCETCGGSRLNTAARHVFVEGRNLSAITRLPVGEAADFFAKLELAGWRGEIAAKICKEIIERLTFLVNVGLNYLSLDRSAETLSGGEAQRIRLASQIGAGLVGVMYILDEPSIGLHQRDNDRLLKTLVHLRDLGNTVIVVEHDEDAIRSADQVVDIGPGAGVHGGEIVAQGTAAQIQTVKASLTGQYLAGKQRIAIPKNRTKVDKTKQLKLSGASGNNLRNVNLDIPAGLFVCVTGVSGSGKSTLINDTLYPLAANHLNRASLDVAPYKKIDGLEHFDKVVDIDQSPIGRTPRSNPATYTGLFTPIRELFAAVPEARARGYAPGRFSFNVKGGRCEACKGDGVIKVEMHFLPDMYVPCDLCKGQRYNRETLDVHYKGKTISEVLNMTVEDAADFFSAIPVIKRKLDTLMDVGLSYITLGQNAVTLSGGEAQRIKLSRELSKRDTGKTLYILDEPTTGLHFHDIAQLLTVLHRLRDHGNTVVVIEHNLDVIKTADWIIDLGPEGGNGGGEIIATGTPEQVAKNKASHTGAFLARMLGSKQASARRNSGAG
jgi:excinuclease ABC subunit A